MVSDHYRYDDQFRSGRSSHTGSDPFDHDRQQAWSNQHHHKPTHTQKHHAKGQTHHTKGAQHESTQCPSGKETPQANAHDNTAADNVAQQFKNAQQSGDYSKAALALGQLQRKDGANWSQDRDHINNQMHTSGALPNLSIVGTDDKGRVLTRDSKDAGQLETRDPVHMNVESKVTDGTRKETRGGREFDVSADGSASYVAKDNRDNDWSIARSALAKDGHTPTNQEVANTVNAMANESGKTLKQMGMIHDGDRINVPAPAPGGTGDYEHKQPGQVTQDKTDFSPVNPPGSLKGTNGNTYDETETGKTTNFSDQTQTTNSNGHLDDSWSFGVLGSRSKFDKSVTRDSQGRLLEQNLKYENPQTIRAVGDNGQMQTMSDVKEVNTKFNGYSGRYETTYTNSKGENTMLQSDKDGKSITPGAAVQSLPVVGGGT